MGCVTSWMYAGSIVLFTFAWPLFFVENVPLSYLVIVLLVNGIVAVNVWHQCSSQELSYFAGLNAISARLMSGCANITLLYLPLVLFVVYLLSIYYSILGLLHRRQNAQQHWQDIVLWFVKR